MLGCEEKKDTEAAVLKAKKLHRETSEKGHPKPTEGKGQRISGRDRNACADVQRKGRRPRKQHKRKGKQGELNASQMDIPELTDETLGPQKRIRKSTGGRGPTSM